MTDLFFNSRCYPCYNVIYYMKKRVMNLKNLISTKLKFLFAALFLIAIVVFTVTYSFNIGFRMISTYMPLVEMSKEVRLQATTAHLWFEEIMSGDREESLPNVKKNIQNAITATKAMFLNSDNSHVSSSLFDKKLQKNITIISDKLQEFDIITDERYRNYKSAGAGTDYDKKQDKVFKEFIAIAIATEERIKSLIEKDLNDYHNSYNGIIFGFSFIIFTFAIILYHYETSRNKRELMMIEQSRFASMGEMIGNIAHQWRQPLTALGLIAQKMLVYNSKGVLDDEKVKENMDKSVKLIGQMSHTIDDFRDFFKPNREKEQFSVLTVLDHLDDIFAQSFKNAQITYTKDIEPGSDFIIEGYMNELSQVMMNLLKNAFDVLMEKGSKYKKIIVEVTNSKNGFYVAVHDNGGGISSEIQNKIFDPYFTTKNQGEGTGIGLYMSKLIIEDHMDGTLNTYNTNDGACFLMEFKGQ